MQKTTHAAAARTQGNQFKVTNGHIFVPTTGPNKPAWLEKAANKFCPQAEVLGLPTKELVQLSRILAATLATQKMTYDSRIEQSVRLSAIRGELARRGAAVKARKAREQAQAAPKAIH